MSLIGNIFRTLLSNEGPSGDTVTQISISEYVKTRVSYFYSNKHYLLISNFPFRS